MTSLGKYLILIGGIILFAGFVLLLFGNKLSWLGKLPGDIKLEKENIKIFIPITTMIIISLVLSFLLWLIRKLL